MCAGCSVVITDENIGTVLGLGVHKIIDGAYGESFFLSFIFPIGSHV